MNRRHPTSDALQSLFVIPPEGSLNLYTSTLECNVTWLIAQSIGTLLQDKDTTPLTILLASFLHDKATWSAHLRRTNGLDIEKGSNNVRLEFVDCFTTILGIKQNSLILKQAETEITKAIARIVARDATTRIVLILDSPDTLLAIGSTTSAQLSQMIDTLRRLVHATFISAFADWPALAAAGDHHASSSPLEKENAAFVLKQAHVARAILSVKQLETGAAKDVSGVLRVTRGPDAYRWYEDSTSQDDCKEMESLYLVHRDGRVTTFARGA